MYALVVLLNINVMMSSYGDGINDKGYNSVTDALGITPRYVDENSKEQWEVKIFCIYFQPPSTTFHHLPPPSTTFHHLPPPSTTFPHQVNAPFKNSLYLTVVLGVINFLG